MGLDLILVEPGGEDAPDDALLGHALVRNGKVVLPLTLLDRHGTGRLLLSDPAPALAAAAAAIGHIHLEIDSDGIVRSTCLREGDGRAWWDHFALAMLRVGGFALPDTLPGERAPASASAGAGAGAWQRDHWVQIPFAGPPGRFERISYVDVLKGLVPPERLAGKYLLVDATVAGLGDAYAPPFGSGRADVGRRNRSQRDERIAARSAAATCHHLAERDVQHAAGGTGAVGGSVAGVSAVGAAPPARGHGLPDRRIPAHGSAPRSADDVAGGPLR